MPHPSSLEGNLQALAGRLELTRALEDGIFQFACKSLNLILPLARLDGRACSPHQRFRVKRAFKEHYVAKRFEDGECLSCSRSSSTFPKNDEGEIRPSWLRCYPLQQGGSRIFPKSFLGNECGAGPFLQAGE
jgi:hypothetical protein